MSFNEAEKFLDHFSEYQRRFTEWDRNPEVQQRRKLVSDAQSDLNKIAEDLKDKEEPIGTLEQVIRFIQETISRSDALGTLLLTTRLPLIISPRTDYFGKLNIGTVENRGVKGVVFYDPNMYDPKKSEYGNPIINSFTVLSPDIIVNYIRYIELRDIENSGRPIPPQEAQKIVERKLNEFANQSRSSVLDGISEEVKRRTPQPPLPPFISRAFPKKTTLLKSPS